MFGIVGLPVPDETLLAFSGHLVFNGQLGLIPTIASAFLGSACGISISYCLGRKGGPLLINRYGHKVSITPEKIERANRWMTRYGRWILIAGYFIPGVRHLVALAAGASRLKYSVFAIFAYTGALLWSATFVVVGFFLEKEWKGTSAAIHRMVLISVAAIAAVLLLRYIARRRAGRDA
jgi:membrane protein DedA with SNARE-associated domain